LYTSLDITRQIISRRMRWGGMWHAWERGDKCTGFWWESLKERAHLRDQGIDGRMGLEWILGRLVGGVWNGFVWLRIGTNGWLL
jgi:hypothetical protein